MLHFFVPFSISPPPPKWVPCGIPATRVAFLSWHHMFHSEATRASSELSSLIDEARDVLAPLAPSECLAGWLSHPSQHSECFALPPLAAIQHFCPTYDWMCVCVSKSGSDEIGQDIIAPTWSKDPDELRWPYFDLGPQLYLQIMSWNCIFSR